MRLGEKIRNFQQQFPYLLQTLFLIWNAAQKWTLLWCICLCIQGLLPVAVVYLTRSIVDGLVDVMNKGGGWADFQVLLTPIVMMVTVLLVMTALRSAITIVRTAQSLLVEERIISMVHEKAVLLDLSKYESSEFYDQLFRAKSDAAHRPLELVESLGSLLQNSITLLAMSAVLLQYSFWAPAALFVSTFPVLYVVLDHRSRQHRWHQRTTRQERMAWYYDWLITSRENASEVRLFEIGDHFKDAYLVIKRSLRFDIIQMNRSQAIAELISAIFALMVTGLAMGWMVWRVIAGTVTLGDLALFYQAFNQGQQLFRSLLQNIGQIYGSSLFLGDFFDFLKMEPSITSPPHPVPLPDKLIQGISFENVSFGYPLTGKTILENFSLQVEPGKITAIVGVNGAGKSTLVKLLCRLYDPDSGMITVDGINLSDADIADVRNMTTVLFQEPVRYNMTVADNIRLGNISVCGNSTEIEEAARAAGAEDFIAKLPDGYDTQLGRWFPDSTDLSGGEWQRLALARAFLRRSPVIVLDEPTRAMDSWSEIEWLSRFRELADGRTALVITHRFTTAMLADVIHVMDNGKIIESGTHLELLAMDGRYAFSWKRQMKSGSPELEL